MLGDRFLEPSRDVEQTHNIAQQKETEDIVQQCVSTSNVLEKQQVSEYLNINKVDLDTLKKPVPMMESNSALMFAHTAQQEKLALELQRVQEDQYRSTKIRQMIREDPELMALQAKLATAYVSKQLNLQIMEKRLADIRNKKSQKMTDDLLQRTWASQAEQQKENEKEEILRKYHYRQDLETQMVDSVIAKQELYQEFLREKLLVDEIVQKIQEEDQLELTLRMEQMKKNKKEMDEFKEAQEIWRQKERASLEEENRRLVAYLEREDPYEKQRIELKRRADESKQYKTELVAQQLYEKEIKAKELEAILLDVQEAEVKEMESRKHKQMMEQNLRKRIEAREIYKIQMTEKMLKLRQEASEESALHYQLMHEMAEAARMDQMTKEKQRRQTILFHQEAKKIIDERRRQREQEIQEIMFADQLVVEHEKARQKMIEEERINMLKEHAVKLIGYIPRGVLRESDLPLLGPDFVAMYSAKNVKQNKVN